MAQKKKLASTDGDPVATVIGDVVGSRDHPDRPDLHVRLVGRLAELEELASHRARLPITCVEGWSVGADWRGLRLLDVVRRAGGDASSRVVFHSLEGEGYNHSEMFGPQVSKALLATHLNGVRIPLDHGYPLRLIAPDRAGALNTKWIAAIEVGP